VIDRLFRIVKEIVKHFYQLLSSMVLLHAFLGAPLMVECVRTDGLRFIEIIGHDPCRIPNGTSHFFRMQDSSLISLSDLSKSQSPCTDLLLHNPSYKGISLCTNISLRILQCESAHSHDYLCSVITNNDFKSLGKSPPIRRPDAPLQLNLRI